MKKNTVPPRSNGKHPGGRPSKRTAETIEKIVEAISFGLTDQEAADFARIDDLTMTRWRKIPEFCRAIKSAVATRKLIRLKRVEKGETGWQGSAWALERQSPERFARPEILINQSTLIQNSAPAPFPKVRVLTVPDDEFEQITKKPNYRIVGDGRLERIEGSLQIIIVRQSKTTDLLNEGEDL